MDSQSRKDEAPHKEAAREGQTSEQQEVAKRIAPEPVLDHVESENTYASEQEKTKKYDFRKKWKTVWDKWETIEKFTFCLVFCTFISAGAEVYQSCVMKETLIASQRPAVYLGLPDGKVADFVMEEGREQVALYFRNYGQSAAQNASIETWPTVLAPGSSVTVRIPPPEGEGGGLSIPPGFPTVHYQPYPGATREELEAGTKLLFIIGRVRYADASQIYCDTFSLGYTRRVTPRFTLVTRSFTDSCDRFVDFVTTSWDDQDK